MENAQSGPPVDDDLVKLGVAMGHSQSFALLAGRCSAAQAEALRRLRAEKRYLKLEPTWKGFCARHLRMSGTQADKLIALLEEFGPTYFDVAQLTRVSPQTYRALAPSIQNGALRLNGETIELNAENAQKVASAVNELRASTPPAAKKELKPVEMSLRIRELDKRGAELIAEFRAISKEQDQRRDTLSEDWRTFAASVKKMRSEIQLVGLENGIA